ncbi:Uptake hydrogenase large subunit [Paramagnetospirillum magnetotacticum MS-1]|uniref:Uptake hydrogenase large subunit n=1 Tax=Paramagnetospirillum magnetotacticum MS-1 TaxID=272627 RepID=A0A0C2UFQ8_PARME|nr:nickel-dependent hydrogenase large subunit [Paramagnetospirillum magnetotacticum]KIM00358.1 Uptake hydrogenase large subunit [Paramagnetospirillum magnetotacticum MS-1]
MTQNPTRLIVGPFNRVEGDLEVTLDIQDGAVAEARVNAPLYRGFEQILLGRPAADCLVIAPRICGICSVSQSVAAARALADLGQASMPDNGSLATNLILACENAADHLTHFMLFFAPDLARSCYSEHPWFQTARRRFAAGDGECARTLLPARARFLHLMGLLAGKWPHSLALQPGGVTKGIDPGEKIRLLSILAEFREALETHLFADSLESIAALNGIAALEAWADAAPFDRGDFRLFLHIARHLNFTGLGSGPGRFISSGSFGLFAPGVWDRDALTVFDPTQVTEDHAHSWMEGTTASPSAGKTIPSPDKPEGYSWCKAPRLAGQVAEVGALARQMVDGHPLIRDLIKTRPGGSVQDRVVARLLELARLIPAMETWIRAIRPAEPFCFPPTDLGDGPGTGLVEAARGTLGHWIGLDGGRIAHYQIIAPTTWNFSPRDAQGNPGALEMALAGTPVLPGETTPVAVQHVVRSFDPCMVCTVH